jgi:Ca2+:H+ antiporter
MGILVREIRGNPLLWLLLFVPAAILGEHAMPESHTALFVLSVLAIVPLAALLSLATESVAARTGDTVGGLLNATLGNLTGEYMLVKASIAGAIVANTLVMLGASFLIGGLRHHLLEFNPANARMLAFQLFLATIALLVPSAIIRADSADAAAFTQSLSLGLAFLLIAIYALGLVFSLGTHAEMFAGEEGGDDAHAHAWPMAVAIPTLAVVTLGVAMVSEIFVASVQKAAEDLGMSRAFVGFVVVALVGGVAESMSAFSGAWKRKLDLSIGIALGSAAQIALFVAPVLVLASYFIGPVPMGLDFWPGAIVMMMLAALSAILVCSGGRAAWFSGVLMLGVYVVFAMTLYLMPPVAPH